MVADKITGELREIDVLISTSVSGYEVSIAIEVVGHVRKASTPWVESMHSKHSSLPTNKLILVAENGFTEPALRKAKFYGIETLTIDSALGTDWKLATELTATGFFEITSFKYSSSIIYLDAQGTRQQLQAAADTLITGGNRAFTIDQLTKYVLDLPSTKAAIYPRITSMNERQFWFSYTHPGTPLSADANGQAFLVVELRVGLDAEQSITPVQFATGCYRGVPFVEGSSTSPAKTLQFVMIRSRDGTCRGAVVDETGLKDLISFNQTANVP